MAPTSPPRNASSSPPPLSPISLPPSPRLEYDDNDDTRLLDASLRDFEPLASPMTTTTSRSSTRQSSVVPSEAATEADDGSRLAADSDTESAAGGYSPPAWRRLGNGDRSNGFWRGQREGPLAAMSAPTSRQSSPVVQVPVGDDTAVRRPGGINILERAIKTRLPAGSQSPEKKRSPSPIVDQDATIKVEPMDSMLIISTPKEATPAPPDSCKQALYAPCKWRGH